MSDDTDLAAGLYERLITTTLKDRLARLDSARISVQTRPVDPAEAHATFARHIEVVVARALRGLPEKDRRERQPEIVNRLLALLREDAETVAIPPAELLSVQPLTGDPAADRPIPAPLVPLSSADLLVNARGEPALAHALAGEIPSADSIDLLCAFVRWHGLRVLLDPLSAHCRLGKPLRVVTTVYTGSTERKALDWLVNLGAQVKVSYDTQSTRLHAKAWLFRRQTGFSTAYIGSSNLSKSALIDGVEWNVRLSEVGSPDVLEKFDATFESYWAGTEYEEYVPTRDACASTGLWRRCARTHWMHHSSSLTWSHGHISRRCWKSSTRSGSDTGGGRTWSSPPRELAKLSLRRWTTKDFGQSWRRSTPAFRGASPGDTETEPRRVPPGAAVGRLRRALRRRRGSVGMASCVRVRSVPLAIGSDAASIGRLRYRDRR